ncbi:hypothetical protein ACWF0M_10250 [Kribbella sp. NPDC055110]
MPIARTLAEAEIYVALETAQAGPQPGEVLAPAPDFELGDNLVEGPDAWTYRSPIGEITIPYSSQHSSTRLGAHWGLGRSQLIDAAEWAVVAHLYADRTIAADMAYDGQPGRERYYVELGWELAAEAIREAMKSLPEGTNGGDMVPDSEIWTSFGTDAKARDPYLVSRARLEDDLEYYTGTLADFRALHSGS